jgi:hypothetical protein
MADGFAERFPPSITAARLYERVSAKGRAYIVGRLGGVKIAVLKTDETDGEGHPIWELKFSAAPATRAKDRPAAADSSRPDHQAPPAVREQRQATKAPARSFDQPAGPEIADEIPF